MRSSTVRHAPHSVRSRLHDLGLQQANLHSAILAGELYRDECTRNDPSILPGIMAWGKATRAMRELHSSDGWHADRVDGLEAVVSKDRRTAIVVVTGDAMTGIYSTDEGMDWRDREPRSKYPKGPAMRRAVGRNSGMFDFEGPHPALVGVTTSTWLLLINVDEDEIRCELSLPKNFDDLAHVSAWHERIILDPIRRDPGHPWQDNLPDNDDDLGADIDVEVRRIG